MKRLLTLLLLALVAITYAVQGMAGPYQIDLRTDPAIVPVGKAKLIIKVTANGKPVSGATVKAMAQMPGMNMGEREETASPASEPGTYIAPASFAMAGAYQATITISGSAGTGKAVLSLQTGESTEGGGGGFPLGTIVLWGGLIVIAIIVVRQIRRTGQQVNIASIFNRQVLLSLLLLGAALAVAVWFVNSKRREGAMTPMEAQVMEMNTPAPEGSLPVRLGKVESKPFQATVTYSGQAVGFIEQDVVPRVTGAIVWMPLYVGDRVVKGQVLARLDTSQLDPMVSEKLAGVSTARQGVGVASMEYQQAMNMVTQARAEVSMAEGEQSEAEAMLVAAQQGRGSAESEIESARADIQAMQADLVAAEADRTYQQQELGRMQSLFERGAISKDELQRAQAEAKKADAMVSKARENVNRARAQANSAQAMLRKTDAEIAAAKRKVQQAEANLRAKQASVKTAEAGAKASKGKIGQSEAGVAEAAAGLRGATTQRGYSELRSEVDGVVTQRVISPGTIVNPGQTVMRVSQIKPIRLQANVPEEDLARIQLGANVKVTRRGKGEKPIAAKVTSISPSLDPSSRTGIVEALFANEDGRFSPGQYLTMEISIGSGQTALVIPSSAVLSETQETGRQHYVWVAEPMSGSELMVSRKDVQIGARSGDLVEVASGLKAGDQVVLAPPQGLAAGNHVTNVSEPSVAIGDQPQVIEITEAGYSPASIAVPADKPFKVIFIRKAAESCGTQVIFPDLGIKRDLPLNQPVTIEIPPQPGGKSLSFTCPMNMLKGKAVVK
ncbi:MAG: efflux RND transporter periplasmic adaptor subunit [Armatimonadetes bacterium]|nr:efflux RND transporter periplasmic adaptor subunit [Armatimonadota bacterium]